MHAGVDSLEINMDTQKVTVTGYVDQRKVLKVVGEEQGGGPDFGRSHTTANTIRMHFNI